MRLVDATEVVKNIIAERDKIPRTVPAAPYEVVTEKPYHGGNQMRGGIRKALRCIEQAPTVDAVEVVHGRWVSVPHKLARVCSVCNRDEPYKFADIDADVYDYCPNCGAKMDGGADS